MDRLSGALSLCKKAGRLAFGFDVSKQALQNKTAKLVLVSSDLSSKSLKEICFTASSVGTQVKTLPYTMDDIFRFIGKRTGIIVILDEGFEKLINSLLV